MVFIAKASAFIKEHALVVFLFTLLGVGLVLGDGKQMLIDTYTAVGVFGIYCLAKMSIRKRRDLPIEQQAAWGVLILYMFVRTLFSDDVGYSIYVFVRYLEAFLVYALFFCYGDKRISAAFARALVLFSLFVLVVAMLVTVVPSLIRLPPMNLLYPTYGHNHAADLVLFGFASAAMLWIETRKKRYVFSVLLCILGTLGFLARSVMFLEAALLIGAFVYLYVKRKRTERLLFFTGLSLLCVVIVLLFVPHLNLRTISTIFPNYAKQSILEDGRRQYWEQAILAVQDHPFFGTGPGTFFLASKLYQKQPDTYSWFAHSFPLQTAAEVGMVGFVLIFLVGFTIIGKNKIKPAGASLALLVAIGLVLAQSCIDYNLDYVVVWVLLWATVGTVFSQTGKSVGFHAGDFTIPISIALMSIFYVANLLYFCGKNIIQQPVLYTPLCVYNVTCVDSLLLQKYPSGAILPQLTEKYIYFFHRRNPEVMVSLAKQYQMEGEAEKSYTLYQDAVRLDPQNIDYFITYVLTLIDGNKKTRISELLETVGQQAVSRSDENILQGVKWFSPVIISLYTKNLFTDIGRPTTVAEYLSKTYYFLGYSLLQTNPTQTLALWTLARDAAPEWGYFHVELASLEYHVIGDKQGAEKVLKDCHVFTYAARQCEEATIRDIMPGSQYENVQAIPSLH